MVDKVVGHVVVIIWCYWKQQQGQKLSSQPSTNDLFLVVHLIELGAAFLSPPICSLIIYFKLLIFLACKRKDENIGLAKADA